MNNTRSAAPHYLLCMHLIQLAQTETYNRTVILRKKTLLIERKELSHTSLYSYKQFFSFNEQVLIKTFINFMLISRLIRPPSWHRGVGPTLRQCCSSVGKPLQSIHWPGDYLKQWPSAGPMTLAQRYISALLPTFPGGSISPKTGVSASHIFPSTPLSPKVGTLLPSPLISIRSLHSPQSLSFCSDCSHIPFPVILAPIHVKLMTMNLNPFVKYAFKSFLTIMNL